jgi:N-acetylglucosamine-6-phosphate deacetylase
VTQRIPARAALLPDGISGPVVVEVDDAGNIAAVAPTTGTTPDVVLGPGFVDLQVNGIEDVDCAHARGTDWERLDQLLLAQGTTAWCPTLITAPLDGYREPLERIGVAMDRPAAGRPEILGVHLEGPFLGDAPGAHPRRHIVPVDLTWLDDLPPIVRIVTLAAEQPLAGPAIAGLLRRGVTVSIGHSRPTEAEFEAAVLAGATMITHLFNGMSGVHHRDPGLAAFALTEPRVAVGLIADLIHVAPRLVALTFAARPDDTLLVSDATAWRAGRVGEVGLELRDGAPRLPDGTLAGSCLTLDQAIRNVVASGVPVDRAWRAASTVPARIASAADRGELAVGRRADLVALTPELTVATVFVGGHPVH